jgi:hypothetical protein
MRGIMSTQISLLAAAGLFAGTMVAHAGEPVRLAPAELDRVTAGAAGAGSNVNSSATGGSFRSTTAGQQSQANRGLYGGTATSSGVGTALSVGGDTSVTAEPVGVTGDVLFSRQGTTTRNIRGVDVTVGWTAVGTTDIPIRR